MAIIQGNYSTEYLKINGKIAKTTKGYWVPAVCTCGNPIRLKGKRYVCTGGHLYGIRSDLNAKAKVLETV